MKKNMQVVEPDLVRISEALRDTGYNFNMAIADLVDNSVAAQARNVSIQVLLNPKGEAYISIADDGLGMNKDELIDAMRYGSSPKENPIKLGKFGIGLKTASSSFCRRLVVLTKQNNESIKAVWDLDNLAKANKWKLELADLNKSEIQELEKCCVQSGTIVLWEKIDRLFLFEKDKNQEDIFAARILKINRIIEELKEHLALVFANFIFGEKKLNIYVNGEIIEAYDPFCVGLSKFVAGHELVLQLGSKEAAIKVEAFILPREEEFVNLDLAKKAKISTKNQGFYVYRENRFIHGPDWLNLLDPEPHYTLLRVKISFDADLDDAFMVDLKKSRVLINEHIYLWLKNNFLPQMLKIAEDEWRSGKANQSIQSADERHHLSNKQIAQRLQLLQQAKIVEVQAEAVQLFNNNGEQRTNIYIENNDKDSIQLIDTNLKLDSKALYSPSLVNGELSVSLNVSHPFYDKVYLANENNTVLIQALDYLIFCLAQAELNNLTSENAKHFNFMRQELSQNLAKLLES